MPNESLTMRVTDYIFDYIKVNELSTGDTLPSELRTSTELNISRGIVREAFRSLQVAGIIEKENGRSPKVGVLNGEFLTHLMVHAISTKQISVPQVLELRTSVEMLAAELAARKRTPEDVQLLRVAAAGMRQHAGKPEMFVKYDLDFHDVINRASGNPLLEVICTAMHETMQVSMRIGIQKRRGSAEIMRVVESHEMIVDAIDKQNPGLAGLLMKKHFADAKAALAKVRAK